jgi:hypothetical protein
MATRPDEAKHCSDEFKDFTIDPGVGREGSSGVVDSHGQTGTLNCGGKRLNGEGRVTPTEGDCATEPITKGKAVGKITLVLK